MSLRKIWVFVIFLSCNHIKSGSELKKADIDRIKQLHMLDSGESIIQFYSEYRISVAGNFYTNKRIGKYWLDEHKESKNIHAFAFYPNIISIDTVFYAGLTYCPYMRITTADNNYFKVCADGKKSEIKKFFEGAMALWESQKQRK